jgi:hypothetical protein
MNEMMRAHLLARKHDMCLTSQEHDFVLALRSPGALLHDALRMAALLPMLTGGEQQPEDDPEAVKWLAHRLVERLEILEAVMAEGAEGRQR